jgi:hypothetical protein
MLMPASPLRWVVQIIRLVPDSKGDSRPIADIWPDASDKDRGNEFAAAVFALLTLWVTSGRGGLKRGPVPSFQFWTVR